MIVEWMEPKGRDRTTHMVTGSHTAIDSQIAQRLDQRTDQTRLLGTQRLINYGAKLNLALESEFRNNSLTGLTSSKTRLINCGIKLHLAILPTLLRTSSTNWLNRSVSFVTYEVRNIRRTSGDYRSRTRRLKLLRLQKIDLRMACRCCSGMRGQT